MKLDLKMGLDPKLDSKVGKLDSDGTLKIGGVDSGVSSLDSWTGPRRFVGSGVPG